MVKLKRLKILQYRNVRPGTELRFDDGHNLVLGQNGSGKTTLLALISTVSRSVFNKIYDEEFSLEYELSLATHTLVVAVEHRRSTGSEPQLWDDTYSITVINSSTDERTHVRSADQAGRLPHHQIGLLMEWSFVAAALTDRGNELSLIRNDLLSSASAFRYDESLDCFAAMTGRETSLRGPATPPPAFVRWIHRRDKLGGSSVNSAAYTSGDLSNALIRDFQRPKHPRTYDTAAKAFTDSVSSVLGNKRLEIEPQIRESERSPHEDKFLVEGFTFRLARGEDTFIHHDRWSFGQKRLVSFFYYIALNPTIVIADELVNGLHHKWIDACVTAIGDRQAFLTSQNPLLFDYIADFESVEKVQSRFITCTTELVDGAEQLVWNNMSRDHAATFFEAYKDEVEQIGEILIARGLW